MHSTQNQMKIVQGFRDEPIYTASGAKYSGRLTCDDVQITGKGVEAIATFTITTRQLLDAAGADVLWTDQDVQRGVRPEVSERVERELSLSRGYPNANQYIFSTSSADEMTEKLLHGKRVFINPLVWNLRPGTFEAYYDEGERKIYLYDGKVYLPDSHHRHQAILKAAKIYKDAKGDYQNFSLDKQFKVELYFLKKQDEGNYFFDKNQLPTPTAKSKAYDLTTEDDLSVLAKKVIEITPSLQMNVNRVTDRLTSKNSDLLTLSTLRESLKPLADINGVDETELEGLAHIASAFFRLLSEARPELKKLPLNERKKIREISLVDAPIMFQGYGALLADFSDQMSRDGLKKATEIWERRLMKLMSTEVYSESGWSGDFFEKINPLWNRLGVIKPGLSGQPTVSNNRAARLQVSKALRAVTTLGASKDLTILLP